MTDWIKAKIILTHLLMSAVAALAVLWCLSLIAGYDLLAFLKNAPFEFAVVFALFWFVCFLVVSFSWDRFVSSRGIMPSSKDILKAAAVVVVIIGIIMAKWLASPETGIVFFGLSVHVLALAVLVLIVLGLMFFNKWLAGFMEWKKA